MVKKFLVVILLISNVIGGFLLSENKIHPKITLFNQAGDIIPSGSVKFSSALSCLPCHDTQYINNHNVHYNKILQTDCIVCHLDPEIQQSDYDQINRFIQVPGNMNCAECHGIISDCKDPFVFPDDIESGDKYDISLNTGVVFSPQSVSVSHINLKNKVNLNFPWDIHFRRQLKCISCHFTANDPRNCANNELNIDHLKRDPRKIKSTQNYLEWPDHNLKASKCTCCHEPLMVHKELPFKKKHFKVLDCQSCHVPKLYGPALQSVDATVRNSEGLPRKEFRGIDNQIDINKTGLNTVLMKGFKPGLFPEMDEKNQEKIGAYNLVTRWEWVSAKTGEQVPDSVIKSVFLAGKNYKPQILHLLDRDQNGKLTPEELVLDSEEKQAFIRKELVKSGIKDPVIRGRINSHKIFHGIMNIKGAVKNCAECHSAESRLGQTMVLSKFYPKGIKPEFAKNFSSSFSGGIINNDSNELVLKGEMNPEKFYIFGFSKIKVIDLIGLFVFILSFLGIVGHAAARFILTKNNHKIHSQTQKIYMYKFYERLWHWLMALSIIILLLTGFEIHNSGVFQVFGYSIAVRVHNIIAIVLVLNGLLAVFYQLVTGEIKQFFGISRYLIKETFSQIHYYLYGIFKGDPHPMVKSRERKLNPLQQMAYVSILFFLLPFQVFSGMVIFAGAKLVNPPFSAEIIGVITPLHNLASWFIFTFLVVHLYLITTGHSIFSNLKAMATGYDDVDPEEGKQEEERIKGMKTGEYIKYLINKSKRNGGEKDDDQ